MPPRWKANPSRLRQFLAALPRRYQSVFEFRDPPWFDAEVYSILRENRVALCITNGRNEDSAIELTSDFVYIRFHGGDPGKRRKYDLNTLERWAEKINGWRSQLRGIYIYFNNDWEGFAVENAFELEALTSLTSGCLLESSI